MFQSQVGDGSGKTSFPLWQRALVFSLAYFLFAQTGSYLSAPGGTYVSFWLPAGSFVAGLLLNPTRDWPWLALSILPANLAFDYVHDAHPNLVVVLLFYLANVSQSTLGAWLVRRFVAERPAMDSLQEFGGLIGFAGIFSTMVGAAIGTATLVAFGMSSSFIRSWEVWWGSCVMAVLVLAPMVLALGDARTRMTDRWSALRLVEAVLLFGGMTAFMWIVLAEGGGIGSPKIPVLIFVLWSGLRFGLRGASVMVFLLAIVTSFLTTHYVKGLSPEEIASGEYIFTLQIFVAVAALVGLVPPIVLGERDRSLAKLRDSENRFRSLTEAAFEGIFISENGRIQDVSDQGAKIFGYERHELIGKEIVDLVAPAERQMVEEAIRTRAEVLYGHELRRKDGSSFYAEAQARHVQLGGRTLRMTALRDITKRKEAEQALRESEEKFSKAFYSSPDAISITEASTGRFLDVNDGFAPLYGYSREELIGRTSVELNMWRDPVERDKLVLMLKRDGRIRAFPSVGRMRSGELFHCLASADMVEIKGRHCIISVVRDISEQKRAEAALLESEEKFSKAFRTSPDVMSISDLETGCYLEVNEAHEKVFGFKREAVIGRSPQELGIIESGVPREKLLAALKSTGSVRDMEIIAHNDKGELITVLLSAELIELNGRKCVLRVSHDITDRIRAETLSNSQRQVMEMIASGRPMSQTLDTLMLMIETQSPGMLCSILLLDEAGKRFQQWSAPSLPADFMRSIEGEAIGPCAGSCGTAAFRREPVFVADVTSDPLWANYKYLPLPPGLRACWSAPVMDSKGNVLATFAIYHPEPGLPDERHQQLIAMATHTAAVCISKYRTEAEREQSISREQKARIEYTFQLIAAQEAERKRIAAELHDSLGQNLLLIKNLAQMALREQEAAHTYEKVASIDHLAAQCIAETRQISRDLHPHQLDHLGLKRALESMLESVSAASGINFQWKIDGVDELFSAEGAMNLYRIVQESLNNILKHSRAKTARVDLERDIHEVQLRITDDGCGFAPDGLASNKKGLGLKNIPERVRMLGGKMKVDSAPGAGTRIEVTIPIAAEPE